MRVAVKGNRNVKPSQELLSNGILFSGFYSYPESVNGEIWTSRCLPHHNLLSHPLNLNSVGS